MGFLQLRVIRGNLDLGTRLSKSPVRRDRQSGIDIDMIRVVRQDRLQLDCLSVSSGYTTDQIVLGVPLGSPKTSYVPPGSHVVRVRERASSWAGAETPTVTHNTPMSTHSTLTLTYSDSLNTILSPNLLFNLRSDLHLPRWYFSSPL
ncbi:hypothetical protein E6C27_scaffold2484G00620 [Cucumis melo var. makuwa]|uniref:Uncharacterized protein n=1 Tax=Cucumis melo var. makuwa TaxID=1194695 RepID=A0A5A7VHP0_CUCMM|nr:hypothetical protein E6C27_scaffold2484G00620 [Cucumis melo var. makuwa]